ncbi:hypothetical protein [Thermogymnomonas acidicola]|uniref:hypothetical protein n=1 Tax=Thermogymnomonas acidicola TaxID=399579 RepID=UPI00149505B9|nr:hypothetical protein [Thermogymnomonas acidicola]
MWIALNEWYLVFIVSGVAFAIYVAFMASTAIELKGKDLDFLEKFGAAGGE